MGLLANYILLFLGTISLTTGIFYFVYEKNHDTLNTTFYLTGIFQFMWCAGYSLVGFSSTYFWAFAGRAIGLFGVIGFLLCEVMVLLLINHKSIGKCFQYLLPLILLAIPDFFCYLHPSGVSFIHKGGITLIQAVDSPYRVLHPLFIIMVIAYMFHYAIRWLRHTHFQRENRIMISLIIVNSLIIVGCIPDSVLPYFGYTTIPTSGFFSFIAYQILIICARKYNAFSISQLNLNSYIFDYAHSPIMVFDTRQRLAMMNHFGKEFLQIQKAKNLTLSDVFEISKEEANNLFLSLGPDNMSKTVRLVTKKEHIICVVTLSTVLDSFKEPYCTVVFAYDLSKEASMLREVNTMKNQLENALNEKRLEIEELTLQSITTIANTIDAKDAYTKGHSLRVAHYSALLAQALGWEDTKIQNLRYTALLHDIGKIGIPDMILNKPGKLSDAEFCMIQSHVTTGGDILKDILMIPDVSSGAKYHHERYDGTGYPNGLKGEEIPLVARVICIADAYDAMNSNRIYRNALTTKNIRQELLQSRGAQFDPVLLDKFIELLDQGLLVYQDYDAEAQNNSLASQSTNLLFKIVKDLESEVHSKDQEDYLTGLLNRMGGEKKIRESMCEHSGCLAFIDMDNLKHINDTLGHSAGDVALQTLSLVLKEHAHNAIPSRIGGDEFLFYMPDASKQVATEIIEGILRSYNTRKEEDPLLRATSLSAGLCMHTPADSFADVFQKADKALYHVKQDGKGDYYFYPENPVETKHISSVDLTKLISTIRSNGHYQGALRVEYREFIKLYDFLYSLAQRYENNMHFLMITLDGSNAKDYTISTQEEYMGILEHVITNALRNIDICTRFSSHQYLVILFQAESNSIDMIIHRIFEKFGKQCDRKDLVLSYDAQTILELD